ncbi:glycosyltransferase family 2 protein [Pedobacter fastidiosus]|uniref:Glycosyltransferase n=1 Tax=Pedobacter fastidiosus TaxID=2765361 RepID=A0ABR7KR32_9SPHI|nr:glycosyltransferase family 2 protein [Pedobacter fastidiosus]MBC6110547.1 glycosyltransferase [Pedobacter fastidiosus]
MNLGSKLPVLTVITVVYNGASVIRETISSVIAQNYSRLEYLIIDGKSIDSTLDVIDEFTAFNFTVISEADQGIYDAMNKGIRMAKGDYICFLNAGDQFYTNDVLNKIGSAIMNEDVIYGNTCIDTAGVKEIKNVYTVDQDWKTMPYCHQSVFIKRKLLVGNPFDLKFSVAADFDQYHKIKKSKAQFKSVDFVVSLYDNSGFSFNNYKKLLKEYKIISSKNSGHIFNWIKIQLYFYLRTKFGIK